MKIKELLSEDGEYTFASNKQSYTSKLSRTNLADPNYTPGKAALDKEYEETEAHTETKIPNIQKKLDDPRN
jgi:hypothetical protein